MKRILRALGRLLLALLLLAAAALAALGLLRWRGLILLSHEADPEQWELFGVDVSSYQGNVDWAVLAGQGVEFAFIKATEGSILQDRQFAANWAGAAEAGVRAGAYHFLSYDSPGDTQADNYIATVPVTEGALPPVVDIEFYGKYLEEPPEKAHVKAILDPLLERLEEHYGVKPILYVTYRSYYRYIAGGGYGDYPIWCSSPTISPWCRAGISGSTPTRPGWRAMTAPRIGLISTSSGAAGRNLNSSGAPDAGLEDRRILSPVLSLSKKLFRQAAELFETSKKFQKVF